MENYIILCLVFLISTFINVTIAGWLTLKMAEFLYKKIQKL